MQKTMQKILAIFLIFTLTFAYPAIVTQTFAASIFDGISKGDTGSNKVLFGAGFDSEVKYDGRAETSFDVNNKDAVIVLKLNVKDEGYLKNGKIQLVGSENGGDPNFVLKAKTEDLSNQTEYVEGIENNTISLKQIDNGSEISISVPIEFNQEKMSLLSKFDNKNYASFTGTYVDIKGNEKSLSKMSEIEVKWTLHDCWAFTGHCAYFDYANCDKWETGCCACPEKSAYPASIFLSRAKANWRIKKVAFSGIKNMTLIAPSMWLADLTRQSFLKEYPVEVVHNTIDTSIFKPTQSNFRERMGLNGKTMILGVANVWDHRKGLQDFLSLRRLLDARNDKTGQTCFIILVGLTDCQISSLPPGIIGIARTNSASELAEIYSAADWFFNPTHEDNYPTVNLEARACGCRVVTYDTGGSAETVEGYDNAWVLKGEEKSPEGFARLVLSYRG